MPCDLSKSQNLNVKWKCSPFSFRRTIWGKSFSSKSCFHSASKIAFQIQTHFSWFSWMNENVSLITLLKSNSAPDFYFSRRKAFLETALNIKPLSEIFNVFVSPSSHFFWFEMEIIYRNQRQKTRQNPEDSLFNKHPYFTNETGNFLTSTQMVKKRLMSLLHPI